MFQRFEYVEYITNYNNSKSAYRFLLKLGTYTFSSIQDI